MRTQGHTTNPTELDPTTRLLNYPPPELRRMLNDASVIRRLGTQLTDRFVADLYRRGQQGSGRDGWPPGGGGPRGSDISRPTEAAAVANADAEPGERDMVAVYVNEARALMDLLATTMESLEETMKDAADAANKLAGKVERIETTGSTARVNTVEVCALCNQPTHGVRRIDGQPYCHGPNRPGPDCYSKVWNDLRKSRRAAG